MRNILVYIRVFIALRLAHKARSFDEFVKQLRVRSCRNVKVGAVITLNAQTKETRGTLIFIGSPPKGRIVTFKKVRWKRRGETDVVTDAAHLLGDAKLLMARIRSLHPAVRAAITTIHLPSGQIRLPSRISLTD